MSESELDRRVRERVIDELTPIDLEQRFDDMIDEIYSFKAVGGPFSGMSPSRVLRECDETARRCGIADMSDDEDTEEIDGESYERREVDAIREEVEAEIEAESAIDATEDDGARPTVDFHE